MDFTYDSDEIFNSAFINPSDLQISNQFFDKSLSNCFLDTSESFLETPIPRNTSKSFTPLNKSPEILRKSILSGVDYDNFDLPDSCLLFTSNENINCDMTNFEIIPEDIQKLEAPPIDEKKSSKLNCRNVLNYIMRPISNNLIKKINKKIKKSSPEEIPPIQAKIPIQLYSNKKRDVFVKDHKKIAFVPNLTNSSNQITSILNDNNFVNCGDLVTYFV